MPQSYSESGIILSPTWSHKSPVFPSFCHCSNACLCLAWLCPAAGCFLSASTRKAVPPTVCSVAGLSSHVHGETALKTSADPSVCLPHVLTLPTCRLPTLCCQQHLIGYLALPWDWWLWCSQLAADPHGRPGIKASWLLPQLQVVTMSFCCRQFTGAPDISPCCGV